MLKTSIFVSVKWTSWIYCNQS